MQHDDMPDTILGLPGFQGVSKGRECGRRASVIHWAAE